MNEKNKTQLGKILLKQKLVKPDDLASLLEEQEQEQGDHERLASKVLERGYVSKRDLLLALGEQYGMPAADLDEVEIELANLDLIPREIAEKHLVLPVSMSGDNIRLAMANPQDKRVIEEIEFVSGKRVFANIALHSQIVSAIAKCYDLKDTGGKIYRGPSFRTSTTQEAAWKQAGEPDNAGTITPGPLVDESDLGIEVDFIDEEPPPEEPKVVAEERLSTPPAQSSKPLSDSLETKTVGSDTQTQIRILVVDDEEDILLLISRVLKERGYHVITAMRGLEAIEKVKLEKPDIVILDAMLPEVHGFDICKKIKGSRRYGHIPVIMISAIYRGWRYAKDLKESYGVDDFIEKPFKISDLLEKVELQSRARSARSIPREDELSKEAERLLAAGIDRYRSGQVDEAVDLLKKAVDIDPLAAKLHYHLALLLGKKGLNYQAIRSLENALELAPDHFPALKNLAVLYQKAGFKYKAIETWERALGYCPDEATREGIKHHLVSLL